MISFRQIDRLCDMLAEMHTDACCIDASRHDLFMGLIDAVVFTTITSVMDMNPRYRGYPSALEDSAYYYRTMEETG